MQQEQQATAKQQSSQYLLREINGQYRIIDDEEFLLITMQDLWVETRDKIINRLIKLNNRVLNTLACLVDKLRYEAQRRKHGMLTIPNDIQDSALEEIWKSIVIVWPDYSNMPTPNRDILLAWLKPRPKPYEPKRDENPFYWLEDYENSNRKYYGSELSDNSDSEDERNLPPDLKRPAPHQGKLKKFQDMAAAQMSDKFWISCKRQGEIYQKKHTSPDGEIFNKGDEKTHSLTFRLRNLIENLTTQSDIAGELKQIREKVFTNKNGVAQIPYHDFDSIEISDDELKKINDLIFENRCFANPENIELLQGMLRQNNIFTMQYRGINYLQARWNARSRRYHRQMDEVGHPQYSEMALRSLDFSFYTDLSEQNDYVKRQDFSTRLKAQSAIIRDFLIALRDYYTHCIDYSDQHAKYNKETQKFDIITPPKEQYYFNSILDALQHQYSNGIREFLAYLEYSKKQHKEFWDRFPNALNFFVSTGNSAYHPLKYAYGMKDYYSTDKDERGWINEYPIKPRWDQNGKIEYSHVGKVYISLHPLEEMLFSCNGPTNVLQMDKEAKVYLRLRIGHEKETSFLSHIDIECVFYQYIAKYPDFSKDYKDVAHVMLFKYGFDENLYNSFKALIAITAPNTKEREAIIDLLNEWLTTYHTALLMRITCAEVECRKGKLVFINGDGLLSKVPNTVIWEGKSEVARKDQDAMRAQRFVRKSAGNTYFNTATDTSPPSGYRVLDKTNFDSMIKFIDDKNTHEHVLNELNDSFEDRKKTSKTPSKYNVPQPELEDVKHLKDGFEKSQKSNSSTPQSQFSPTSYVDPASTYRNLTPYRDTTAASASPSPYSQRFGSAGQQLFPSIPPNGVALMPFLETDGNINNSVLVYPGMNQVRAQYDVTFISGEGWLCYFHSIFHYFEKTPEDLRNFFIDNSIDLSQLNGIGIEIDSPHEKELRTKLQAFFKCHFSFDIVSPNANNNPVIEKVGNGDGKTIHLLHTGAHYSLLHSKDSILKEVEKTEEAKETKRPHNSMP